ncbi:prefoldin subunit alpha [Sulfurisphaera ohwakuensis]|uniref:Prefoldin subunit alpha n=2 Tax=Sulfurisphaera ohwakuensis TaxID=69656 RepID=A0A650CH14_SULOH|nr:prefoldin subunit alpha [Sulfurisphaera ohwakuensis]
MIFMSNEENQQKVVVSLEDLLAQADALKKYIDYLQKTYAELQDNIMSIDSSLQALKELQNSQELLMVGDKRGNVIFKVQGIDKAKVLVHLGLEYYAEVDPDFATKVLNDKKTELSSVLSNVEKELAKSLEAYKEIADILNQAQQQLQAQQNKGG